MKLTTKLLKKLIREELTSVQKGVSGKRSPSPSSKNLPAGEEPEEEKVDCKELKRWIQDEEWQVDSPYGSGDDFWLKEWKKKYADAGCGEEKKGIDECGALKEEYDKASYEVYHGGDRNVVDAIKIEAKRKKCPWLKDLGPTNK